FAPQETSRHSTLSEPTASIKSLHNVTPASRTFGLTLLPQSGPVSAPAFAWDRTLHSPGAVFVGGHPSRDLPSGAETSNHCRNERGYPPTRPGAVCVSNETCSPNRYDRSGRPKLKPQPVELHIGEYRRSGHVPRSSSRDILPHRPSPGDSLKIEVSMRIVTRPSI